MGAEHLQQSIKGDFLGALQHLEEVADHIRSAQKTFEALPSASTNTGMDAIALCDQAIAEAKGVGATWFAARIETIKDAVLAQQRHA